MNTRVILHMIRLIFPPRQGTAGANSSTCLPVIVLLVGLYVCLRLAVYDMPDLAPEQQNGLQMRPFCNFDILALRKRLKNGTILSLCVFAAQGNRPLRYQANLA